MSAPSGPAVGVAVTCSSGPSVGVATTRPSGPAVGGAATRPSGPAVGRAPTRPSGPAVATRPLSNESVFRIEVSLSSRKSSAIVMRTTARLYSLEGSAAGNAGDAEWRSVAYGAPCLQLMRLTTDHNSPFRMKIVMAEVESGIALWENEIGKASNYHAMQSNFHTFTTIGKTFAIQFAHDDEAGRMLESIQDLLLQKEKAETVAFDKKIDEPIFKKPKALRRLSKKDISAPCNFKHVSGITLQRTPACEEELRGTIQRKMRSMSLSALNQKSKARSRLPDSMIDGSVYATDRSPELGRREGVAVMEEEGGRRSEVVGGQRSEEYHGGKSSGGSLRQKFGSLRLTKKKGKTLADGSDSPKHAAFTRDEKRMSLPSHHRRQVRVGGDIYNSPQRRAGGLQDRRSPNRALSLSSGNLVDLPSSHPHSQSQERLVGQLDRRHTVVWDPRMQSPTRMTSGSHYNYTPYSQVNPQVRSSSMSGHYNQQQQHQQQQQQQQRLMQQQQGPPNNQQANGGGLSQYRPYQSDMSLNRLPPGSTGGHNQVPLGGNGGRGQRDRHPSAGPILEESYPRQFHQSQPYLGGVASSQAPPTLGVVMPQQGSAMVRPTQRRQSLNEMQVIQMNGSIGGNATAQSLQRTTIMEEQRGRNPTQRQVPATMERSSRGDIAVGTVGQQTVVPSAIGSASGVAQMPVDHMTTPSSHVTIPASHPSHVTNPARHANMPTSHVTSQDPPPQSRREDVVPYATITVSSNANPATSTSQTSSSTSPTGNAGQTGSPTGQNVPEHYDLLAPKKANTPAEVNAPQAPSNPPTMNTQQTHQVRPSITPVDVRAPKQYTPVAVQPPTVGMRPIQPRSSISPVEVKPPQAPKHYTPVVVVASQPGTMSTHPSQQQRPSSGYQQHNILQSSPPQGRRQGSLYTQTYVQPVHGRSHSQPHQQTQHNIQHRPTHQAYNNPMKQPGVNTHNPMKQQGVNMQYYKGAPHVNDVQRMNYPQGQVTQVPGSYYAGNIANGSHMHRGADTQVSPSHTGMQVAPVAMQQPMKMQHQAFGSAPVPAQIPRPYQTANGVTGMRPVQGNPQTQYPPQQQQTNAQGSNHFQHNHIPNNQSPQKNEFQPNSTAQYDTLPSKEDNDSKVPNEAELGGGSSSASLPAAADVSEELAQYTEQMSKALEQFDSLLQPQSPQRQIMQTSL